ncbi:hypothetical protein [Bacillus coreaensis]
MKNRLIVFLISLLVLLLGACNQVDNSSENENKTTSVKTEDIDQSSENEETTDEAENSEEPGAVEEGLNFQEFRPEVGSKKTFTSDGEVIFTEEIISANDEYVQTLFQLGDNLTTEIYRWTKDEVTLLSSESNSENPRQDQLPNFTPLEQLETFMANDANKQTTWKLLSVDGTEEVPAGTFQDVLMIQKSTNEVVDEETTLTRYYAPKVGLIKEIYTQSGENGFTATSVLEKVE